MPQVLYNPVKVYDIDLRQTGSSFKKNSPQIAIVNETQMDSSVDWQGSRNNHPGSRRRCFASVIT
ncbi:hypothetical protein I79_003642 [Cricetulus griseus]|uniref:Uncharacterized protein n=1 Tax=Cricetulus griseus TaxID=10029 RepID=G3H0I4_CRIGR|nr:hypothetical protein I79_003642 [Cricetulus griseus]